ncbi:helix-turn-helix transcriptional regulator [Kitasatospora sp. NA04385]|uniref:winged helix-turn-helix domain-containing protein n=1 Tax=Kitasatospora sp. NA04385 TaxID=2742135 RepID=UPI00159056DE|nr:helix-turn-helix domain-containing protein [Kitasatospora sp. NA04385]QKW23036.1 helix-turn-helix transcriptional regulator [Kitasatospora sp. NA04385]
MSEELPAVRLTDPRALRAYTHPTRMALVGLLRLHGPLTATRAAELLGTESVASCSFHLRQLAKYGLVEEAGGGRGREKPWRATAAFTSWDASPADPERAAATEALQRAVLDGYFTRATGWLLHRGTDAPAWREAASFGDSAVLVTAEELTELNARIAELTRPYVERLGSAGPRPAGARTVQLIHLAVPTEPHGEAAP